MNVSIISNTDSPRPEINEAFFGGEDFNSYLLSCITEQVKDGEYPLFFDSDGIVIKIESAYVTLSHAMGMVYLKHPIYFTWKDVEFKGLVDFYRSSYVQFGSGNMLPNPSETMIFQVDRVLMQEVNNESDTETEIFYKDNDWEYSINVVGNVLFDYSTVCWLVDTNYKHFDHTLHDLLRSEIENQQRAESERAHIAEEETKVYNPNFYTEFDYLIAKIHELGLGNMQDFVKYNNWSIDLYKTFSINEYAHKDSEFGDFKLRVYLDYDDTVNDKSFKLILHYTTDLRHPQSVFVTELEHLSKQSFYLYNIEYCGLTDTRFYGHVNQKTLEKHIRSSPALFEKDRGIYQIPFDGFFNNSKYYTLSKFAEEYEKAIDSKRIAKGFGEFLKTHYIKDGKVYPKQQ